MAYVETSRSRPIRRGQHEVVTRTVGVALSPTDSGIPAEGDFLDDDESSPLNAVAQEVLTDPTVHVGRVFVTTVWVELQGVPSWS